ncbi:MAG: alkaline phosphatase family protein [Chloroflexia bacterium]|nr:alkaline phosphatase family protein [Chloroflexia bacterium]
MTKRKSSLVLLALVLLLAACGPSWELSVPRPDGSAFPVNRTLLEERSDMAEEVQGQSAVPLERILFDAGHRAIESLVVITPAGDAHPFEWAEVAGQAWWLEDGDLYIAGQVLPAAQIQVEPPARLAQVQAEIIDIAPTVAAALNLPRPAQAGGRALATEPAEHVLLLFLDGFGYLRYEEARERGLIPHLAALEEPRLALTTYPPITCVSTASLLTGAMPNVHGAEQRGIRQTEVETIFDVASAAGLSVAAVEGESLAFNLRGAEMQLSGDRDGNGLTDDNVLANALAVLQAGMPNLFLVHFHGIDDAGHTYGPGAPEEEERIRAEDEAVGQLLAALPPQTMVIIFADHGMHVVQEEGRLGNHEHLIERDVLIPLWVISP